MSPDLRIQPFKPAALGAAADAAQPTGDEQPGRNAAHAAGYAAGYAAGARAAAEQAEADRTRHSADHDTRERHRDSELQGALAALAEAATRWEWRATPVLDEAEQAIHSAALEIVEAILARELQSGPGSARTALARALALPDDVVPTRIRLCPTDLAHIQRAVDEGEAELPAGTTLAADPRLSPGDAVTEFQDGILDGRIASAVTRVREALLAEEEK